MQINPVSNYTNKNTVFRAKLKLTSPLGKLEPKRKIWDTWIDKAKRIGLENDVIEIRYGLWKSKPDYYHCGQDNFFMDFGDDNSQKVTIIANMNGKIQYKGKYQVEDKSSLKVQEMSDSIVEDALDKLYERFPNDIWD